MKKTFFTLLFFTIILNLNAQSVIKLWGGNPPTSNGATGDEIVDNGRVRNVINPDITVYQPDKDKDQRKAIIICPGGGYTLLAIQHEGYQFAEWLKEQGFTAIVLKYRLPNTNKNVPLEDVQQAIRYVKSKANEWNIDKVGVAGFSAGGHLASTASTHFIDAQTRPDFSVLFYPVISMAMGITHQGSRNNLLGDKPLATDIHKYSNEKQINSQTPPAILLLSDDDKAVIPQNSIGYYKALKRNDIAATMYIFPTGGHGWGMNKNFKYHDQMLSLLKMWLESI